MLVDEGKGKKRGRGRETRTKRILGAKARRGKGRGAGVENVEETGVGAGIKRGKVTGKIGDKILLPEKVVRALLGRLMQGGYFERSLFILKCSLLVMCL